MITFETKIREQTVRIYSEMPLKNAVGAIFRTLADISQKTTIFTNNFVLCFGWSYFFMNERQDENGEKFWVLQAGDYQKIPNRDRVDDATTALVVQNMQVEGIQVAKCKPEATTCMDTILVLKAAMNADEVYMSRSDAAKNGDSGWYFGLLNDPDEDKHTSDEYERIPSYQLMGFRTEALRVLQMPVGTVAVFNKNEMTALIDGNDQPMKFTTEEERKVLAEKQRAEFNAQIQEAHTRAQAVQAAAEAAKKAAAAENTEKKD